MNASNWMEVNHQIISNKKLREITLPATHDSATHDLELSLAPDVAEGDKVTIAASFPVSQGWAKAQSKPIYKQLSDGIRYLDLRVAVDNGVFKSCHSFYGPTYNEIFNDVRKFVDENPKELVLLGLNHFWDYAFQNKYNLPSGVNAGEGLTDKHLSEFIAMIENKFENRLVDGSKYSPTSTLGDLWSGNSGAHRNQVIVLFNKDKFNGTYLPDVVDNSNIWFDQEKSMYKNTLDKQKYKNANIDFIKQGSTIDKFFAIKSAVTPDNDMYIKGTDFTGTYPSNLKELASDTNPVVLGWIKNEWSKEKVNMIWSDYYHQTDLVKLALHHNGIPVVFNGTDIGKKTNWGKWKMGWEIVRDEWIDASVQIVNLTKDGWSWFEGSVNGAVDWVDDLFSTKKKKAEQPTNGIVAAPAVEGITHYRIVLTKIKVKSAGGDDTFGTKDLELYGAINLIPQGTLMTNKGANKYLWHKSNDQFVSIKENKSKSPDTAKDIYGIADEGTPSNIEIKINLKDEDGSNGDDKLKGSKSIKLSSIKIGATSNYSKVVKSGSQKVEVSFKIKRIK